MRLLPRIKTKNIGKVLWFIVAVLILASLILPPILILINPSSQII